MSEESQLMDLANCKDDMKRENYKGFCILHPSQTAYIDMNCIREN